MSFGIDTIRLQFKTASWSNSTEESIKTRRTELKWCCAAIRLTNWATSSPFPVPISKMTGFSPGAFRRMAEKNSANELTTNRLSARHTPDRVQASKGTADSKRPRTGCADFPLITYSRKLFENGFLGARESKCAASSERLVEKRRIPARINGKSFKWHCVEPYLQSASNPSGSGLFDWHCRATLASAVEADLSKLGRTITDRKVSLATILEGHTIF